METPPELPYKLTLAEAKSLPPKKAAKLLENYNDLTGGEAGGETKLIDCIDVKEDRTAIDTILPGAAAMWNYWKDKKTDAEMEELLVVDAAVSGPDVLAALKKRAAETAKAPGAAVGLEEMRKIFLGPEGEGGASAETKKKYEAFNEKLKKAEKKIADSNGSGSEYDKQNVEIARYNMDEKVRRWYEAKEAQKAAAAAKAAAPTPGGGRKGHASTLRGIGKMGPAMLHKELERYEKIKAHLQSKYAHVVAMGETKRYTKEEVDSAIKQLKDKIAAKGAGGRRHTRRHRRARAITARRR